MLPYSPLHHLLLADVGRPLVMTSGNLSDEPIAHEDDDATDAARTARRRVAVTRPSRSTSAATTRSARGSGRRLQVLRRSRGYAPEPLPLPFEPGRAVLALGAELKSTIAVTKGSTVVPSHHLGDLEHLATYTSFLQAVEHLPALYGVSPEVVAHDLHPEYLSSKHAAELELPTIGVQHHHAHVAACMVEHGRTDPVVGLTFDGLGYGTDGTMWGGEVMVADFGGFERVAHLRAAPMPGGVAAIREPWRMAAVWAMSRRARSRCAAARRSTPPSWPRSSRSPNGLAPSRRRAWAASSTRSRCSSEADRTSRYEAQAAIELEALARTAATGTRARATSWSSTTAWCSIPRRSWLRWCAIALPASTPRCSAGGFHESFGTRGGEARGRASRPTRDSTSSSLTGGVFQNALLTEVVESALTAAGLRVLVHSTIPPNDGGISVGQAAIAGWASASRLTAATLRRGGRGRALVVSDVRSPLSSNSSGRRGR